ncbi:MAG TPA: hypothetical protein VFG51_02770 [Candidatus Saccharimonadia bacterium]|nr:hypothetical protein [Candidatus Saccharimonadia bacterium]
MNADSEKSNQQLIVDSLNWVSQCSGLSVAEIQQALDSFTDSSGKVKNQSAKDAFFRKLETLNPENPGTKALANAIVLRQFKK